MNDFTKEELETILKWADTYHDFGTDWTYKLNKPLMDKIRLMIDNYCEYKEDNIPQHEIYKLFLEAESVLYIMEKKLIDKFRFSRDIEFTTYLNSLLMDMSRLKYILSELYGHFSEKQCI